MANVMALVSSYLSHLQTSECQIPLEVVIFCLVHAAPLKIHAGRQGVEVWPV